MGERRWAADVRTRRSEMRERSERMKSHMSIKTKRALCNARLLRFSREAYERNSLVFLDSFYKFSLYNTSVVQGLRVEDCPTLK